MAASARIVYISTALGGSHLAAAARYTILAQQEVARAKSLADSITNGGVDTANLEGSAEFGAVAGAGATLYTAISGLSSNLATVTVASLAKLDQG
jgi:hypothetical protein